MTKRWAEVKQGIRSISDEEKREVENIAYLTSLLSQRRRLLGLTQMEVAERAGLTQPNVARIEKGEMVPRLDTLCKMARALDMKLMFEPLGDHEEAATAISR